MTYQSLQSEDLALKTRTSRTFTLDELLNIAVQSQYLTAGHGTIYSELQEKQGHVAVAQRIAELAVIVHDMLRSKDVVDVIMDVGFPGVFEYEIAEPMGTWFANHSLCTDDQFRAELQKRVTEWLS